MRPETEKVLTKLARETARACTLLALRAGIRSALVVVVHICASALARATHALVVTDHEVAQEKIEPSIARLTAIIATEFACSQAIVAPPSGNEGEAREILAELRKLGALAPNAPASKARN